MAKYNHDERKDLRPILYIILKRLLQLSQLLQ